VYILEFRNEDMVVQTKRVARWDLVMKVVEKLLPHPMFTSVKIKEQR